MIEKTELARFFGGLRSQLEIIERSRTYTNKYFGDDFNVFDLIGYDENRLSDVISKLLDPKGGHGQGTMFLSAFLRLAAAKSGEKGPFSQIEHALTRQEKVRVWREHPTAAGRRIDIVVDIGKVRFAIENKPRAADQDKQIDDYILHLKHSHGNDWVFMYLNGYGAPPSEVSISKDRRISEEKVGRYIQWDYYSDLSQWVQQCAAICEADKIRWFLRDFRAFIMRDFVPTVIRETQDA